jgi:hypothetical protein
VIIEGEPKTSVLDGTATDNSAYDEAVKKLEEEREAEIQRAERQREPLAGRPGIMNEWKPGDAQD